MSRIVPNAKFHEHVITNREWVHIFSKLFVTVLQGFVKLLNPMKDCVYGRGLIDVCKIMYVYMSRNFTYHQRLKSFVSGQSPTKRFCSFCIQSVISEKVWRTTSLSKVWKPNIIIKSLKTPHHYQKSENPTSLSKVWKPNIIIKSL